MTPSPLAPSLLTDLTAYRSSGRLCGSVCYLHPTESRATAESDNWFARHIDGPGIWFILWIENTKPKDRHAGETRVPLISDNTAHFVLPSSVLFSSRSLQTHARPLHTESLPQAPDCP